MVIVSNIQSSCHLSISGHDTKADHKPKNEPAGFSPSLDGLYCWESNIYAASTDLWRKEEKLDIFFLPFQSSSNRLSSSSFSTPLTVFIDQPKSCRLGPSSRKDRRWHFRNCRSRKKEKQKLPSDKLVY